MYTHKKLTIHKTLIRPIWTYGVELWGSVKPSSIQRIQSFHQKSFVLSSTLSLFYVTNQTIHQDLDIHPIVTDMIQARFHKFKTTLSSTALTHMSYLQLFQRWPATLPSPSPWYDKFLQIFY